jgi:competence protein ComEC
MLVPLLKKRGIQQIDYLIISHQDADHIGGLQAVLEQIPVKQVVFNGTFKPGASVEKLFQTALDKGATLVKAYAEDSLEVDEQTMLHILSPSLEAGTIPIRIEKEQNGESVVFLMEMQGTRWLFTGDVDQVGEEEILRLLERKGARAPLAASASEVTNETADDGDYRFLSGPIDVMKIAHHGSKTSSSPAWLDAWQPRLAVISVGGHNVYGHPNPQVMDRLQERKVGVLRTDRHGEIQMRVMEDRRIQVRSKLQE